MNLCTAVFINNIMEHTHSHSSTHPHSLNPEKARSIWKLIWMRMVFEKVKTHLHRVYELIPSWDLWNVSPKFCKCKLRIVVCSFHWTKRVSSTTEYKMCACVCEVNRWVFSLNLLDVVVQHVCPLDIRAISKTPGRKRIGLEMGWYHTTI